MALQQGRVKENHGWRKEAANEVPDRLPLVQCPMLLFRSIRRVGRQRSRATASSGGEFAMYHYSKFGVVTLTLALFGASSPARAWDDAKYPDWKGQWERVGGGSFDTDKRPGRAPQPPLNAEYMAVWEANMKDEATGGQSYNTQVRCLPGGMPRMMIAYQPMEVIITPDITYIAISFFGERRRVYTDGRDWPATIRPSFS